MRSEQELRNASGYADRPRDFSDLLRILDGELRLITPSDPEAFGDDLQTESSGGRYYQLTHDYLVHSLRDWLTRKQRETRHGRAELVLEDRYALWKQKKDKRYLPGLAEVLAILLHVGYTSLQADKRLMVKYAISDGLLYGLYYVVLSLLGLVVAGYLFAYLPIFYVFARTMQDIIRMFEFWFFGLFGFSLSIFIVALVIYTIYTLCRYICTLIARARLSLKN
jgi:hypothetical protein